MRTTGRYVRTFVCSLLLPLAAGASPGDLDTSFGTSGKVLLDRGFAFREGTSVGVLSTGKYVVTGVAWGWDTLISPVVRYNADHTIDTSFAYQGESSTQFGIGAALKVVAGDKTVVAENPFVWVGSPAYRDVLVARYNADGSLDTTFGTGGRTATFNAGVGGEQRFNALAVGADGKIVAAGYTTTSGNNTLLLVARYNADGSADNTFGTSGRVAITLPTQAASFQEIRGVAVDSTGRIVLTGIHSSAPRKGFALELSATGTPGLVQSLQGPPGADNDCNAVAWVSGNLFAVGCGFSLGGGNKDAALIGWGYGTGITPAGWTDNIADLGGGDDQWRGLTVAADGKIYATGHGGAGRLAVKAFFSNGTVDTSFGTAGVYTMPENEYSTGVGIAATTTEVLVTGRRNEDPNMSINVAAFNRANGARTALTSFTGTASTNFGTVRVTSAGQIIVGGETGLGATANFVATRLSSTGALDTSFGNAGYSLLPVPGMTINTTTRDMFIDPDGKIVLAGDFGGFDVGGEVRLGAARLTAAGTGDGAFNAAGTPGYAYKAAGFVPAIVSIFTRTVSLQSDGKIVATGASVGAGNLRQIALARFNADGTVDTSYGTAGLAATTFPTSTTGRGAVLTADGKMIAFGDGGGELRLARFGTTGTVETTVSFPMPAGYTLIAPNRIFTLKSGKILVLMSVTSTPAFGAMAVRFTAGGVLDTTYGGGNGWAFLPAMSGAGATGNFFGGTITADGKLVGAGTTRSTATPVRGTVVRFTADGVPDATFGSNGVANYLDAFSRFQISGVTEAPDGGLLLVGDYFPAARRYGFVLKTMAEAPSNPPRASNISTRMQVLTGNDVMIAGFIVGGSTPKTVVVNVAGPSLVPFGITNALMNPTLRLVRSSDQSVVKTNDDWQTQSDPSDVTAITASGFKPNNTAEPAIIATLSPGAYTAIVEGAGGTTGVGLVGVFEVDAIDTPLINISTRGQVQTNNDVMIAGFIVQGTGNRKVVINVAGPSLVPFGITNALGNPKLRLVRSSDQSIIATNDDWQTQTNPADVAAIQATGFQPNHSLEPAIIADLPPGAYTAIVEGVNGTTGVGLVGVFTTP